jgi:hypothetical protein
MLLFVFLVFSWASVECPIPTQSLWAHYADEWGHEEKPELALTQQEIKIGKLTALRLFAPKTCTKYSCDVTFVLKQSEKCFRPLLSVQGKLRSFSKGDWRRFENLYVRSSVDSKKTAREVWRFNEKEQKFEKELKPLR